MGEYDYDGDLSSHWEARLVGSSTARKALWLFLFPIVELLRPLHIKKDSIDRWTVWNVIAIVASDVLIWQSSGVQGLAYILLSTFFGVGLHIVGGRWIQEHYIFQEGQETYSYYGPLNLVSFNVGYHYEHHDLVQVPWVHLPKIKALAPECYEHLYAHQSWGRVLTQFLFDKKLDLYSRMIR
jgi:sphingolipid delta-4 desaturase